jgi:hypothetical protein
MKCWLKGILTFAMPSIKVEFVEKLQNKKLENKKIKTTKIKNTKKNFFLFFWYFE